MTATLIDGKKIAATWQQQIATDTKKFKQQYQIIPGLAVILLGTNPASTIYVANKQKAAAAVGFNTFDKLLPEDTTEEQLLQLIAELNHDKKVHGILVQLPLPAHINSDKIITAIDPFKDVDGFHPFNVGKLLQRKPVLRPCTPWGIMQMLAAVDVNTKGMHSTVVGASNIVGRPMAMELLIAGSTVTVCHRFTKDLALEVSRADLVISAVGKPGILKGAWLKPGAIVVDVGINRLKSGKIVGDVEFETAKEKAALITPVPGGVGPMTVAALLANTLKAAEMSAGC